MKRVVETEDSNLNLIAMNTVRPLFNYTNHLYFAINILLFC